MLLALGLTGFTACSEDDDYSIYTQPIVQTVTTGNAEVSAVSANVAGTVTSLKGMAAQSYTVGVCYMEGEGTPTVANMTAAGSCVEDAFNIAVTGLKSNTTYSYRAFVTLQKSVTYYGETKTLFTVDAKVKTLQASNIKGNTVVLNGSASGIENVPSAVGTGFKIGVKNDAETIKNSYNVSAGALSGSDFSATVTGLLPNATYYYIPYVNLGSGYAYGEAMEFTTATVEYEFVDLGIGLEVATFNVGASAEGEKGALLTYGDVSGLGLNTASGDIFGSDLDVAKVIGAGRMPTKDEIRNLLNTCQVEKEGNGYRITGPNGNSVFFPEGNYWTGSAASADGFASTFEFNTNSANLSAQLTDQLLAVRPVRKAPTPIDVTLLQNTWYIDLDAEGTSVVFDGPMYYYGTNDSWTTVTDQDNVSGDSWNWCPDWKGNSWLCPAQDYGTMTFTADGKVIVKDLSNGADYEGTYTVDTNNKTITLEGAKILHLGNFNDIVSNWSTELKIMSLTEKGLQIAALRDLSDEGPCLLVTNFCSEDALRPVWQGVPASLNVSDPNWSPSIWADPYYKKNADVTGPGTYTAAAQLDGDINGVNVFTVDILGYTAYVGELAAEVTTAQIDKITIDGNEVPCDNSKILYGDIEGNGNFRIEIYNEYGAGTKDNSPIDISLMKGSYVEVTFTLGEKIKGYEVNFMTCDTNWNWQDHKKTINLEAGKQYTVVADHAQTNGMIDCIDFNGLCTDHPGTIIRVDEIKVDGTSIAFDANKMGHGDVEGKGNYRIEFFNTYGGTGEKNLDAFGAGITEAGGNKGANALACNEKIEVTFTVITLDAINVELTTCDSNWNSAWPDATAPLKLAGLLPQECTITLEGSRVNGMIDLVELKGFAAQFPNAQLSLKSVAVDGNAVSFDASKILAGDLEGNGNYRVELYNCYGGSKGNSAFADEANDVIPSLGFNEKIEVTVSIDKLF